VSITLHADAVFCGVTVTVAVLVTEPFVLVAVSVYVAVALGKTVVEPVADVDVNPPGLMPMLVAPLVLQLSELLPPALMLVGFAVNELIVGFAFTAVTVTVAVLVTEPALLVAVSV
jgi:hypothetical protein